MMIDSLAPARHSGVPTRLKPLAASIRLILAGAFFAGAGAAAGELPVPRGAFASVGRADHSTAGNKLIVNQHSDRAVLNWQSFNIGKDSAVQFKQPGASAIALNRIYQNDPSRILGTLSANGQIYLLNQNGFVFGKDSKVDVNTLLASTLDISDDTFQRGITKVLGQDGRPALVGKGEVYRLDEQGNFVLDENGRKTKIGIEFQPGAKVSAAKSGRIIAAAPKVENQGNLTAPDGQILLIAATDKVYLQEAGSDSGLRGLLVEVGTGGEVTNIGKMLAERGNVTLMGFAVNQKGRVSATTSVQANGSVRLLAREGGSARREGDAWLLQPGRTKRGAEQDDGLGTRATVVLASGSSTEASPDLKDKATAVDGQTQDPSRVEIMGQQVRIERGATLRSSSGQVTVSATENPASPGLDNVRNDSRVYIDQGAVIDVSGVKRVSLPMERNVATLELRSNELRDSPLQRNGVLYAQKVKVDIRKGTPIADISGALDRIARTVAERSTAGGSLNLVSEGDAVVRPGSLLDFSGGSVLYRPGYVNTTQLLISDGRTVDIGVADPNQHYTGIMGRVTQKFPAWHITKTWDLAGPTAKGRFERGYVDGKAAGSLSVKAAALALEGEMQGGAVAGTRQRNEGSQPDGGTLRIDLARSPDATQAVVFQQNPSSPNIAPGDAFPRDPADGSQPAPLAFSGDRFQKSGIMHAEIATNGKVAIRSGETVTVPGGGSLSLTGGEIAVDGGIRAQSGEVKLTTRLTSATLDKLSGAIALGSQAKIDASGGWINDRPAESTGNNRLDTGRILLDGGKVSMSAQGDVNLAAGSLVDVSGGARRTIRNALTAGNAGSIKLEAAGIDGSDLSLAGSLQGYALIGGRGGSLSLVTDQAILGGAAPAPTENGPKPPVLAPEFFGRGGFAHYSVASNKSGVAVADGADIKVSVQNRVLDRDYLSRPSGSDLRDFSHAELLPEISRPAGELDLVLAQKVGQGGKDAAIKIGSGARLATDAGGIFSLTSDTGIFVDGTLNAPAGQVAMTITPPTGADPGFLPGQGIWIGGGAAVNVAGRNLLQTDGLDRTTGEVLPGGTVTLHADRGFVVAQQGSVLDVSGTSARLDLPAPGPNGSIATASRTVASPGGRIEVRAAEGIQLYGDLQGKPGAGAKAAGGELSLELNPRTRNEPDQLVPSQLPFPKVPSVIALAQSPGAATPPVAGEAVPSDQYGRAVLNADQVTQGGFSSLSLRTPDRIEFTGSVNLATNRSIVLDAPVLAFQPPADAGETFQGSVSLKSPYVALGSSQTRPGAASPSSGTAGFDVQAGLVDLVGTAVLQGFTGANLASSGDMRLVGVRTTQQQRDFLGEFLSPGDLTLTADQIYPTTLSDFRIAVQGKTDGALTVKPGDSAGSKVLSAGGKLTLEAPNIVQGGTLKAPLGQLNLKAENSLELADGSVTSNSARGSVIPFGRTQGGLDWIYPLGEQNLVFDAPPEKKLALEGKDVKLAAGSVVDTSGGGDLYAFEFVPGIGGSYDLLDPASAGYRETYAVLPGFKGTAAPEEPLELAGSGLTVGDSVYLAGGGGLKEGRYVLLPAHYALLPGAYLVTPEPGTTDLVPGQGHLRGDGAPIVAGYRTVAGTSISDSRWSGFAVETGDAARLRAEYSGHRANAFFADKAKEQELTAPYLPRDAGSLLISAETGLNLDGRVSAEPASGGRGGRLDIQAADIAILARSHADQPVAGAVNLVAENLNNLGVPSIAIGGVRSTTDGTVTVQADASTVRLEQDAKLTGSEFILTARNDITLAEGSGISASGPAEAASSSLTYKLDGDAAFLRASSSGQAELLREGLQGKSGSIAIGSGATISASGSMIVDATANAQLAGTLETRGGSMALGASRISLGDITEATDGLALTPSILGGLKVNELILSSGSDISLFGAVDLAPQRLVLRSGGLLGYANAGQTASLRADDVRFENPLGASSARQGDGTGNLSVSAKTIEFGEGSYRLQGWSAAGFEASGAITGEGTGTLAAAADLTLKAAKLTGGRGADTTIDAGGHSVSIQSSGAAAASAGKEALGARLSITADNIRQAGAIALPSGVLKLDALTGDVVLAQGSTVDASGREVSLGKSTVATDGGSIQLAADTGNVILDSGAGLKLGGKKGGSLSVAATGGAFTFAGTADAHGTERGGRFSLDANTPDSGGDLGGLTAKLAASGFSDEVRLRVRSGDLHLAAADTLAARSIEVAADQGAVRIEGRLNAAGANAEVNLRAGDELRLAATATVQARGTADQGGKAVLESVSQDGIAVEAGAKIDVGASDGTANGVVNLRAARSGADVAVSGNLRDALAGAKEATVEAVRTYAKSGTITAADIAAWKADTDAYMAGATAIETRLGLPGGLRPGLEIRSGGDLALGSAGWDLSAWRYDGRPGVLTLAAGGDLTLGGKLSDGFKDETNGIDLSALLGTGRYMPVKDMLQPGESWSYRLAAGGDVTVGSGVAVRTGTGDIRVDAGRDLVLADSGSVIYTAGRPTDTQRYGSFKNGFVAFQFYGDYPVDGGDIAIAAGRDVIGARTGQFFDGWLVRTGNWTQNAGHTGETPTAWGLALGGPVGTSVPQASFQQNVGALGGGNVTVSAGRNVADLTVVIPTTGKQTGQPSKPDNPSDTNFNSNEVLVSGGGNLRVTAGGDVTGGTFYTGRGTGEITAAGSIAGATSADGTASSLGPVLGLGDSKFSLQAGSDIALGAALNPTVINNSRARNFFFTYSADSGIGLQALSGNVEIQNDITALVDGVNELRTSRNQLSFPGSSESALSVYPASLNVAALQGNIALDRSFVTYPAAGAGFNLYAGGDIATGKAGDNVNVTQSDADPSLLPGILYPAASWEDAAQRLQPFGDSNLIHAQVPVHRGDGDPVRIYAQGDIASSDPLLFSLAKPVDVQAGRDLLDVSFQVQHPDYAVSSLAAGRDIRFTSPRNAQGNLVNLTREVQVAGPGQLWVSAGRNIDLGASEGVYTIGNTNNRALAEDGASISVLAGLGDAAHFDDFAKKYDPLSDKYADALTAYMRQRNGDAGLDRAGAAAAYQALPEEQRKEFLLTVLFTEIRMAATKAALSGRKADYDGGFEAIDALFPGAGGKDSKYQGDLKLFFSKIHTVDGGDINLLVPGGEVNAGLAVAFAGSKPASDLGIVAQRAGAVNAAVDGNFLVNQSRVFAMDGGDITLWSSNGNIDAGRGAKSAIAAPPPIVTFDEKGNLKVEFPPVVSGSGIRTAASTAPRPGDVYLAAPRGVVDAGEAGIGGTNITIAATAVIGASNIDVGGTATGVPVANVAPPVTPAGATAAAAAATQTAQQNAAGNGEDKQAEARKQLAESAKLNPIAVEVLGFGECVAADIRNGKPGCV